MMEIHPLLQREYHDQITICHKQPNLPPRTPYPVFKVGVGTWIGHVSHGFSQCNGGFQLLMDSQYHCVCISQVP